ncbi:unnamed protein product, partial [Meganyctiphanes norvegica]
DYDPNNGISDLFTQGTTIKSSSENEPSETGPIHGISEIMTQDIGTDSSHKNYQIDGITELVAQTTTKILSSENDLIHWIYESVTIPAPKLLETSTLKSVELSPHDSISVTESRELWTENSETKESPANYRFSELLTSNKDKYIHLENGNAQSPMAISPDYVKVLPASKMSAIIPSTTTVPPLSTIEKYTRNTDTKSPYLLTSAEPVTNVNDKALLKSVLNNGEDNGNKSLVKNILNDDEDYEYESGCSEPWYHIDGGCYVYSADMDESPMSWYKAEDLCESMGGRMASLGKHSTSENDPVLEFIKK